MNVREKKLMTHVLCLKHVRYSYLCTDDIKGVSGREVGFDSSKLRPTLAEGHCPAPTQPATVVCKMEASVGIRTRCMHVFARLAPDLHARSGLSNEIVRSGSQSEVYQESVVGWAVASCCCMCKVRERQ